MTAATLLTGFVQINGTLSAAPNSLYWVQYFANPSGGSQGQTLLETATVSTDASGVVVLNQVVVQGSIVAGDLITATATLFIGGQPAQTSAFSAGIPVTV